MTLSFNSVIYFGRYSSVQTQVLVSLVEASASELAFWNTEMKSVMNVENKPKVPLFKASFVWTAAQLFAVPSVIKERVYPTLLLPVL